MRAASSVGYMCSVYISHNLRLVKRKHRSKQNYWSELAYEDLDMGLYCVKLLVCSHIMGMLLSLESIHLI